MNKRLVRRIAKEMYHNRLAYKYAGDKQSDYYDSLRFLRMWHEEYRHGGKELIHVWCRIFKAGIDEKPTRRLPFWSYFR